MTTNRYFNNGQGIGASNEQNLVEANIIEYIQAVGQDFYYIPRDMFTDDPLFQEVPTETYSKYFCLEMYIMGVNDFGGQGEIFSKFGLEVDDTIDLVFSRKRFNEQVDQDHPLPGDLIYFPLSKHLFEIKFVEDEPGAISGVNQFYSLSKLYTYKIKGTLYRYSYDEFNTSISEIDTQLDPDIFEDRGIDNHHPTIEEESTISLDWSESNPFGETTGN